MCFILQFTDIGAFTRTLINGHKQLLNNVFYSTIHDIADIFRRYDTDSNCIKKLECSYQNTIIILCNALELQINRSQNILSCVRKR